MRSNVESIVDFNIWTTIEEDGIRLQKSMDQLNRKQTGSYYTSIDLTIPMMKELVASLEEKDRLAIYSKKFLEPCVGTGNFVFAYIFVCKEFNFSKQQYEELLNNIYVCDINEEALKTYKTNLCSIAQNWFGICLDDEYFDTHMGHGVLFDVNKSEIEYVAIDDVFENLGDCKFDFVVTNPPYKNLKAEKGHYADEAEYYNDREKYVAIKNISNKIFKYSTTGTMNIYKLFVEEIIENYLTENGYASLLIPSSILSDKTCSKLRTRILNTCSIGSIKLISENSAYVDASQALCAIRLKKGSPTKKLYVQGALSNESNDGTTVDIKDILDEDTGNSILVLTDEEYQKRNKMKQFPLLKNIPYIFNLRGELDISLNKNDIKTENTPYCFLRGRNIGYYLLKDLPSEEFVDEAFTEKSPKKRFFSKERIACQQIVNMAKKRRISFAPVPPNCILGNSCNFVYVDDNNDNVDIYYILAVLNSSYIDWYFKLTSSNNHINNYEIDNFPIPINYGRKEKVSKLVKNYINNRDGNILSEIEKMIGEAYGFFDCEDEPNEMGTIFSNSKLLKEKFYSDLSKVINFIDISDIESILSNSMNADDLFKKYEIRNDEETYVVASNIIDKYKKIGCGEVLNHTTFKLSDLDLEMIQSVPQGGSWKDIPAETVKKSKRLEKITKTGGRTTLYGRIDYSKPSYTITTYFNRPGNGTYVHPVHERVISVREAARFQSFPDDYYFIGNKSDKLKQVGNAVPVILAYNIGKSIKEKTGCCISVDLFSGAGGMTYGFKQAGINAVIANDFFKSACITLKTNSPEIPVLCGDITKEKIKEQIITAGIKGNADIICGGPPCQGFSLAGFRKKDDPRNELFRHFVDIVSKVNPKVIVFENVEGILSYQGGETFREILSLFNELGYNAEGRKLSANNYAVPQRRKRVIILCTRKDMDILPSDIFPEEITGEKTQISAYETIGDLENIECSENAKYENTSSSTIIDYFKGKIDAEKYIGLMKEKAKGGF